MPHIGITMYKGKKTAVVITAGGRGTRMGAPVPKQFLRIGGRTILERTVNRFLEQDFPDRLVITLPQAQMQEGINLLRKAGIDAGTEGQSAEHESRVNVPVTVVPGGSARQDSVWNALQYLQKQGFKEDDLVLVQDGVRPFTEDQTIQDVLLRAEKAGAAIAALPAVSTIRHITEGTLDRSKLYSVQTPQGFQFGLLIRAFEAAAKDHFSGTDEAGLVERIGVLPEIAEGTPSNIKITTPEDLQKMSGEIRIGTGFDVHRLVEDRKLILGGVEIPYEKGLLGHSDADVLVHALMDAMLGAAALGDIGKLFPDNDPAYAGADSMKLLARVCELLKEHGWALGNADMTVICQRPKLAGYIQEMRQRIAEVCGVSEDRISVKATTTEKLGFTGRGEGIAAEAVCTITAQAADF
jgi:2-C-methyl-D-erythritol 4-phosphate cytidylyltransferase/2-C-methyl-D-erythritol 2,4-cyclodiphosphate synthase